MKMAARRGTSVVCLNEESKINLDCFWDLAETNREVRLRAAEKLLNSLIELHEEGVISSDLDYSICRLIKGLGSSRKAARQGFTLALTQILRIFTEVALEDILKQIENHLSLTGSKNDTRNNAIGKVFAFSAIVHSGKLKDSPNCISDIVISSLSLYKKHCYVHQVIQRLFNELFNQLSSENFTKHVWPHLKKDLKGGWENCTPNNLWLLFICLQSFPDVVNSKFLKKYWNTADILDEENFVHIAKIIKQSTAAHPHVHPLCTEIVKWHLGKEDFKEFWRIIIDENLFASGQGEKIFLGYEITKMALPFLKHQKQIRSILLPNFCQVFMRCSLNRQHTLNSSTSDMGDHLARFVSEAEDPNVQIALVEIFLKPPGTLLFDKITKKKTFANIISYLKADAVKSYAEMLKTVFVGKDKRYNDTLDNGKRRSFAIHQLSVLVGHPAMTSNNAWKREIIQFLLLHSFFIINKSHTKISQSAEKPIEISDSLREDCRSSLTRALEFMLKSGSSKSHMEEKCDVMVGLLEYTDQLLNLDENFRFLADFDEIKESWSNVLSIVKKLQKQQKKDGKVQETCSFQIIFIHLALQLLVGPQQASDILKELEDCCKRALKSRHRESKNLQAETESEENAGEPQWIEVVVDLLLSLLSQSSHLARRIVMSAFPYFCPFLTTSTMDQIMNVINPKKCSEEELMEGENDDADFESGSSDEEEKEEDTVNEELRERIKLALGQAGEEVDDSEHYLTDSEMLELDDALSAAFASQKYVSHKKPNSEEIELLHFRLRCLDLLVTFLKSGPPPIQVIRLISPLVSALEYGLHHKHQSSLAEKVKNVLQIIIKYRKWNDSTVATQEELKDLLQFLMSKAKKTTDVQIQKILSQLCNYVVLCSKRLYSNSKNDAPNIEGDSSGHWYIAEYKLLLKTFLENSTTTIHPDMFSSLLTIHPEVAWEFTELLLAYAFQENIRLYKRTQILGILLAAIKATKTSATLTLEEWRKFCSNLIPPVIKEVQDLISSQKVKTTYTIEILDILATVATISKNYDMNVLQNYEDIRTLQNLSSKQRQRLQKKGRQLWRKVLKSVGL